MLQQEKPQDFVIASGQTHTVREFTELAFKEVGIDIAWEGNSVNEKGINKNNGKVLVEIDEKYFRPAEVEVLLGDPSKAERELGWKREVSFQALVSEMVSHDLNQKK
jgi:GDPmannose 4,6-dehydratase